MVNPIRYTTPDGSPIDGLGMYTILNYEQGSGELRITCPDPYAPPSIDFKFFENEFDLQRCREMVRTATDLNQSQGEMRRRWETSDEDESFSRYG